MASQTVISSFIKCVSHADGNMTIEFKNGKRYRYIDVPAAVYTRMITAANAGTCYIANIKGKYKSVLLSKNQL